MRTFLKVLGALGILSTFLAFFTFPRRIAEDPVSGIGYTLGFILFWYVCTLPFHWKKKKPTTNQSASGNK
jgi:hypothetical protein